MKKWRIVLEDGGKEAFVENVQDPSVRHRAPDWRNRVHGYPQPPFIVQQSWDRIRSEPALFRRGDIVIATFPKTGTTFMEQIVFLLLEQGDPTRLRPETQNTWDRHTGMGKVWVETLSGLNPQVDSFWSRVGHPVPPTIAEFKAMPRSSPRVLKTHASRDIFLGVKEDGDLLEGLKLIYVTRNARDACVSSYYHAFNPHKQGWPFDAWVVAWSGGLFESGTLFDHNRGWSVTHAFPLPVTHSSSHSARPRYSRSHSRMHSD